MTMVQEFIYSFNLFYQNFDPVSVFYFLIEPLVFEEGKLPYSIFYGHRIIDFSVTAS